MEQEQAASPVKRDGPSFPTRYGTLWVNRLAYQYGGRLAVELVNESGEYYAMLSGNILESAHLLGEGEFFAMTYSENEEIAEDALASGVFRDTVRTSGGVLEAPIWAFN